MSRAIEVASVAEGVWQVPIRMPYAHNPVAYLYIVLDDRGRPHLIDSGLDTPQSRAMLEAGLATAGTRIDQVRSVTITHLHRDHLGLAASIRERSGAALAIHRADAEAMAASRIPGDEDLERWGIPESSWAELKDGAARAGGGETDVDRRLEDADRLDIEGRDLRVIHTPGHTTGSSCFVSDELGVIFTGDHLLPDQFPGIDVGGVPSGNPVVGYGRSLRRVLEFDDRLVLPGHGWAFRGLAARVIETLAHHRRRTEEVRVVAERAPEATAWDIAEQLSWSAGWDRLTGVFRLSAVRQTAWHLEIVRAG
ncbi:MAG TPA: MBL fold metallo-hydrolase [Microbacteriaceae bacterium]|nr:MBL fold metallo-hydrolase [Microbacteriaceae bacterium]